MMDSKTKPSYTMRSGLGSKNKSFMTATKRSDRIVPIVAQGKSKKFWGSSKSLKPVDVLNRKQDEIEGRDEAISTSGDFEPHMEEIDEKKEDTVTVEIETMIDQPNQSTVSTIESSHYTSMNAPFLCITNLMDDIGIGKDIVLESLISVFSYQKSDDIALSSTVPLPNVSMNSNEIHKFKSNAVKYSPHQFRSLVTKKFDIASVKNNCVSYNGIGSTAMSIHMKTNSDDLVPKQNQVLVQIEASTVTTMDSEYRLGLLKNGKDSVSDLEIIPGSAFVGCVQRKGENVVNTQIKERVASFCPQGGANSEFVKVEDASLVQVPDKVSSLSAAICVGVYLPVFQALNIGLPLDHRYDFEAKPLDGKSILYFTEPTSSFVQPLVHLAKCLGASDVYIPVNESSDLAGHLSLIGAAPFDPAQKSFDGCIDILIHDSNIPTTETIYSSLTDTGFAVTIQKNDENMSNISSDSLYHYNTTHSWTSNLEESKKDLIFLLDLVKKKHLIPKLARTLRLSEVPEAHSYLDAKAPLRGTFVCLPWHKGV